MGARSQKSSRRGVWIRREALLRGRHRGPATRGRAAQKACSQKAIRNEGLNKIALVRQAGMEADEIAALRNGSTSEARGQVIRVPHRESRHSGLVRENQGRALGISAGTQPPNGGNFGGRQ